MLLLKNRHKIKDILPFLQHFFSVAAVIKSAHRLSNLFVFNVELKSEKCEYLI